MDLILHWKLLFFSLSHIHLRDNTYRRPKSNPQTWTGIISARDTLKRSWHDDHLRVAPSDHHPRTKITLRAMAINILEYKNKYLSHMAQDHVWFVRCAPGKNSIRIWRDLFCYYYWEPTNIRSLATAKRDKLGCRLFTIPFNSSLQTDGEAALIVLVRTCSHTCTGGSRISRKINPIVINHSMPISISSNGEIECLHSVESCCALNYYYQHSSR